MPRTKKEPVDPEKVRRWFKDLSDPKMINAYAGVLVGTGSGCLINALIRSKQLGFDQTQSWIDKFRASIKNEGTLTSMVSMKAFSQEQTVEILGWNFQRLKEFANNIKAAQTIIAQYKDRITIYDNNWAIETESWTPTKPTDAEKARRTASYTNTRAGFVKMIAVQENIIAANIEKAEPYQTNIDLLTWGWSLVSFGGALWVSNNPEVMKEAIDAIEKVTIRFIDESSEIIGQTGKWTVKAIDEFIPWFWQ